MPVTDRIAELRANLAAALASIQDLDGFTVVEYKHEEHGDLEETIRNAENESLVVAWQERLPFADFPGVRMERIVIAARTMQSPTALIEAVERGVPTAPAHLSANTFPLIECDIHAAYHTGLPAMSRASLLIDDSRVLDYWQITFLFKGKRLT